MRLLFSLAVCCTLLGPLWAQDGQKQPNKPLVIQPARPQDAPSYGREPTPPISTPPGPTGGEGSAPVPEPSALFLVGTGLLGVAVTTRLRRRRERRERGNREA